MEHPDDTAPVNPAPLDQPDPPAQPEAAVAPALPAGPQWPRLAEPETDEAWEAMGITRLPVEAAKPVETFEQRVKHRKARRSAILAQVGEELFAWAKTLASAAVYATLIVTFGFQVARVEGQSMAPTLEDQDRLIVNKLAYFLDSPKVGDVVMLLYPKSPDKSFVKRIVAEPLDSVRIVEGKVYVNDEIRPEDYIPEEYRSSDDLATEVVPEGYYFVMGDHRNNSSDSRSWGFVPKKYILGRVQLRWWPFSQAKVF